MFAKISFYSTFFPLKLADPQQDPLTLVLNDAILSVAPPPEVVEITPVISPPPFFYFPLAPYDRTLHLNRYIDSTF